jgi:hypothetical protein
MTRFAAVAIGLALAVFLARTAHMQTPAPAAPPASTSIVVASPTYVSIPMEITVNRPAAEVWKRIGGYCAIAEWFQIPNCTITQGKDGRVGRHAASASSTWWCGRASRRSGKWRTRQLTT